MAQTGIQLLAANPTTVPDGTVFYNSAAEMFRGVMDGFSLNFPTSSVSGSLSSTTASSTITNLTTFGQFSSAFVNQLNRTFRVRVVFQGSAAGLANTFTYYIRWNSTTLFSFTPPALTLGQTVLVILDVDLCVTVIGASGSVVAAVRGEYSISSGTPVPIPAFTTTTVNLTTVLNLAYAASAASVSSTDSMSVAYRAHLIL